jgi:hypothetical protein
MVPKTTRKTNDTPVSGRLYLALELSQAEWKLGFTIGLGQAPRFRHCSRFTDVAMYATGLLK